VEVSGLSIFFRCPAIEDDKNIAALVALLNKDRPLHSANRLLDWLRKNAGVKNDARDNLKL
jgi:hypothetical protein